MAIIHLKHYFLFRKHSGTHFLVWKALLSLRVGYICKALHNILRDSHSSVFEKIARFWGCAGQPHICAIFPGVDQYLSFQNPCRMYFQYFKTSDVVDFYISLSSDTIEVFD